MTRAGNSFKHRVESLVSAIPSGRVITYGQIAALCGSVRAARIVGGIAHYGSVNLPWHRVVNKQGGLATGYPGGQESHRNHLVAEGIAVDEHYRVDMAKFLWNPDQTTEYNLIDDRKKRNN